MFAVTNLTSILVEQERTRVHLLIQCKPVPLGNKIVGASRREDLARLESRVEQIDKGTHLGVFW
jgi:hypothetical protein